MHDTNACRVRGRVARGGFLPALALTAAISAGASAAEPDAKARMELGRKVFTQIAQPSCGICHTLEDAGTKGKIGAKLDEVRPDEQRALLAIREGVGVMPRYQDKLTDEQIRAVAYYVSQIVRPAQ